MLQILLNIYLFLIIFVYLWINDWRLIK